MDFSFLADPRFWRTYWVLLVAEYAATTIVVALSFLLVGSALSRSPSATLKRRAVTFAWIALPSAPISAGWALNSFYGAPGGFAGLALILWTNIFAALGIGGFLRRFLTRDAKPLDILSLPLPVLVFSIVVWGSTALFTTYGLFPSAPPACRNPEIVLLSYCGVVRLEGFFFSFVLMVILISIGMTLSIESPLIRACSAYRHAAKLKLIIALGVAAVVIGALIEPFLDYSNWYRTQNIVGFLIIGIFLFLVLLAALLFMFVQRLQQLSNAIAPTLDRPRTIIFQRMPVNAVEYVQPQVGNVEPSKQHVDNELDVQALKEAIKNRRRHFEPVARTPVQNAHSLSSARGTRL